MNDKSKLRVPFMLESRRSAILMVFDDKSRQLAAEESEGDPGGPGRSWHRKETGRGKRTGLMPQTRWSDIREQHIERIGRQGLTRASSRCSLTCTVAGARRSSSPWARPRHRSRPGRAFREARISQVEKMRVARPQPPDWHAEALGGRPSQKRSPRMAMTR